MKNILITIIFLFAYIDIFGIYLYPPDKFEYHDKIFYNRKEFELQSNPLEIYFEKNPNLRPNGMVTNQIRRRYLAKFEIIDNQLYLTDIEVLKMDSTENKMFVSVMSKVFPNRILVKLDWMTGLLLLPHVDEHIKCVNNRVLSIKYLEHTKSSYKINDKKSYVLMYEKYTVLEIDKGNLNRVKNMNRKEFEIFKKKQLELFKKTTDFESL